MNEITDWSQTPAAVFRGGGYSVAAEMTERARSLESEKRWQHAEWEARMDAADAALAAKDLLIRPWREAQAEQRVLADRVGLLEMVYVQSAVPPEIAPLYALATLEKVTEAVYVPAEGGRGLKPANEGAEQVDREYAAKLSAARAAMDAINAHGPDDGRHYPGNLGRTVAGPEPVAYWDA